MIRGGCERTVVLVGLFVAGCRETHVDRDRAPRADVAASQTAPALSDADVRAIEAPARSAPSARGPDEDAAAAADVSDGGDAPCTAYGDARKPAVIAVSLDPQSFEWSNAQRRSFHGHVARQLAALEHATPVSADEQELADRAMFGPAPLRAAALQTLRARHANLETARVESECRTDGACALAIEIERHAYERERERWRGYSQGFQAGPGEALSATSAASRLQRMGVSEPCTP